MPYHRPVAPSLERGGSWILFGGAFDPVHRGHLKLTSDMRRARDAAGVLYLPVYRHPLKSSGCEAEFEHRAEMLRLAIAHEEATDVSTIESELPETNYTLDTVRVLKQRHPNCQFSFLIGADNLPILHTWHKSRELLAEITLLVGSRPDHEPTIDSSLPREAIVVVPTSLLDISSTQIREAVRFGAGAAELSALVPDAVAEYILDHRLYQ